MFGGGESKRIISYIGQDISGSEQVTCTYPQTLSALYSGGELSHELPDREINPLIFTFSGLDNSEVGQLSYIDATQTISNVPIVKISDTGSKIVYIEMSDNYLTVHTIYPKEGISSYAKNLNFLGNYVGTLSMGTCVGY